MGYMHINNLYKDTRILQFKKCYSLEKIHGTSAHISWDGKKISFFSGGETYEKFVKLFNSVKLVGQFMGLGHENITIFGEAYGGKQQGMSPTYGKELKFIVFDVQIGERWMTVPVAKEIAEKLELDFVDYCEIDATVEEINRVRDLPSVQAKRNGILGDKKREGIVLRPLYEERDSYCNRIMAKHKNNEFMETKTPRDIITDKDDLKIIEEVNSAADEFVTDMRLTHVLDKFPDAGMDKTGDIIKAMIEDVAREGEGEIIMTPMLIKAISKKTSQMFKKLLQNKLNLMWRILYFGN